MRKRLKSLFRNPYFLIVLFFTIFGTILRFYSLGTQSVWFDEAISGIAAKGFEGFSRPVLPSGLEYGRAILHTVFVALSYAVFGFGETAGRIPAALLGTLSIPLAYLVGSKVRNRRVGIFLAFFVAFATVQIAWSRQIRFYQQLQFFLLLSIYFFESLLEKMNWKHLFLTLVSLGCMVISHDSLGYLMAVSFVIWFLLEKLGWFIRKLREIRNIDRKDRLGLALFLAVIILFVVIKGSGLVYSVDRALSNNVDYLSGYLDHFKIEMGGFFFLAIPGAFLGVMKRKRNLFYVFSFLLSFYVISNHILAFQHRYVFVLFPLLFLFSAFTLDYLYEKSIKLFRSQIKPIFSDKNLVPAIVVSILVGLIVIGANFTFSTNSHYDLGNTAPQGDFRPSYSYIERNWRDEDVIVSTLTPVSWFYLEQNDYWISFSHWGFHELPNEDRYTGATVVQEPNQIREIAKSKTGWVVLDLMGRSRANSEVLEYIDKNFDLIEKVSGRDKGVWVYRFG